MIQPVKGQSNHPLISQSSHLQRILESAGFALTIQLPPLLTVDASDCIKQVASQAHQFDAVLTSDASDGGVAVSSLAMAVLLKRAGIEAVVQISGRDRNRLALQGDLLGLGALGIHNLLIDVRPVTRASLGQNADARLVTDLNGPALLATAIRLRDEGRFLSGASIKRPPVFYAGVFFSLEENIEIAALSSAQFVVTTPVYDVQHFMAAFAVFQSLHSAFLSTRPLLVSLPLTTDSAAGGFRVGETNKQQMATSLEALRAFKEIRGFNIIIGRQADLASLEQIVHMVNVWR